MVPMRRVLAWFGLLSVLEDDPLPNTFAAKDISAMRTKLLRYPSSTDVRFSQVNY